MDSLLAVLVGLALGSFLNVVITRLPRGESVWAGRSRCPQCRSPLSWYDNIPLCSYLWLRGRCRACGAAIPWRYPLVELAGGLMGLALWQVFARVLGQGSRLSAGVSSERAEADRVSCFSET